MITLTALPPELPTSVRVGAFDFKIIRWETGDAIGSDGYGECCITGLTIKIAAWVLKAYPVRAAETMLHEILHAIAATSIIRFGGDHPDSEERAVKTFGLGLTQVLRDNPRLVSWLTWQLGDVSGPADEPRQPS